MKNLTLINGIFTPAEMKEVVINMIANKINFHHLKNLRSLEKTGIEDKHSKNRLDELHQLKKEVIEMNLEENQLVNLNATIEIEQVEIESNEL